MPDKKSIYNLALSHLAHRPIVSLTEETPARYALDVIWGNGAVNTCLEQALWTFAMRTQRIPYDPSIEPDFGYRRAFPKPADWIRTASLSDNEYFDPALDAYVDEQQYWYADVDTIYVRFVSEDASYGGDINGWSPTFVDYVAMHVAVKASKPVTGVMPDEHILRMEQTLLRRARSKNSMNEPARFPRMGSWASARLGRTGGSRMNGEIEV